MSKRTLRRAAEREIRKTSKTPAHIPTGEPITALLEEEDCLPASQEEELTLALAPPPFSPFVPKSATPAQIIANQANAQLSTGPKSVEGKAAVSQNNRSHGLVGDFRVLLTENCFELRDLSISVYAEHNPQSDTERRLADSVIQHYWLMQRAIRLQEQLLHETLDATKVDAKRLALFLRYQTTHERSYYRALRELQNIRTQNAKQEIGFESQKRMQEAHQAGIRRTHAQAMKLEVDAAVRQTMEAPLPGLTRIPIEEITKACSSAIATLVYSNQFNTAGISQT